MFRLVCCPLVWVTWYLRFVSAFEVSFVLLFVALWYLYFVLACLTLFVYDLVGFGVCGGCFSLLWCFSWIFMCFGGFPDFCVWCGYCVLGFSVLADGFVLLFVFCVGCVLCFAVCCAVGDLFVCSVGFVWVLICFGVLVTLL